MAPLKSVVMAGKHASEDNSQFYRDLLTFGLRWFLGAVIIFGGAWFLTTQVFGGDVDPPTSSVPAVVAPTSTSTATSASTPATAAPSTSVVPTPAPSTPPETAPPTTAPTTTTTVAVTTTTVPTTLGPELSPSELTARVLNSTGRTGLAAVVTDQLAALGYIMRPQDNYTPLLSTTTVFYVAGLDREAATLAGELAGETIIAPNPASDPSAELLVVLGSSYP